MSGIRVLYSFPSRVCAVSIGMTAWYQVWGLLKEGVHVELYCGSLEKQIPQLNEYRQTLVPFGIKIPMRLLGHDSVMRTHDKIVAKALRHSYRKSHIDLVHCWPSGSLETLKTARELGIKTVLERPSAHTRFVFEVTSRECKRLGIRLGGHYSLFNSRRLDREEEEYSVVDKLLCPSKHVMRTFLERGFDRSRLLQEQYGYDPDVFFSVKKAGAIDNMHPFTIVYVGEGHPLKGLHFALQAWIESQASRKGRFYICGNFLPEYRDLLNPLLAHPSVEYLGFKNDVAKIMRQCDALVLPSLSEGCSLVTCEARACGCVLLVSDAACEVCEHMKNGLVHKAGDVNELQRHIDMLASDAELLERLRANSLTDVNRLTWEMAAKVLVGVYQACIADR